MIGTKVREFKTHKNTSLDNLVPENNFYHQLEVCINLGFVRVLVEDLYSNIGRPSIDPVVFFKLQLIAFFEGIRSERKLMETVNLNLAHRWYLGYDLDESLPDHGSFSKIRDRIGLGVFQSFFEEVVQLCSEVGLVWGEELYFDFTKVQANATINGMVERTEYEASHHLDELFPNNQPSAHPFEEVINKFDGKRITGIRKLTCQRVTDQQINPTDPHASPMPFPGRVSSVLGYRDHYVVDGGKARIILSALVTPASIMDNTPMLDLTNWVCSRWNLEPEIVVGDAKYGTEQNIVGLEEAGIKAYLPIPDLGKRTGFYPSSLIRYLPEEDCYVCPQGQQLSAYSSRKTKEKHVYRAHAETCNACPVKSECTNNKSRRKIFR